MKQIVMLQGMGNNERGWARLVSKFGRVVLIQLYGIRHVEIWQYRQCVFNGREKKIPWRKFWEALLDVRTLWRSIWLCWKYSRGRKIDVIIAATYMTGIAALMLRWFGKARKVVALHTDYLPSRGPLPLRMHRGIINWLTEQVSRGADEVWTVSGRTIPKLSKNPRTFVVPICIDDHHVTTRERSEIGYIGFFSRDHGLEMLFDICRKHGLRLNLIGDSRDPNYLKFIRESAPPGTVFHGVLNDNKKINEILARCFCGYAVYRNTSESGYSYYGIPSKTFSYFASNTPVVTTKTAEFTQNIEKFGIGRVVEPTPGEIEKAVLQIKEQFPAYYEAINRFREKWNADAEQFHAEHLSALWGK